MDATCAANVIPFPRSGLLAPESAAKIAARGAPSDELRAVDDEAGERLRRAMQALEAAVVAQRGAVAQWRSALETLGSKVGTLHATMQTYDSRLSDLRGRVDAVTVEAKMLEAWADAAEHRAARGDQEK